MQQHRGGFSCQVWLLASISWPLLRPPRWVLTDARSTLHFRLRNRLTMHILSTMRHAEGKDRVVYSSAGFWLRYMLTSWGHMVHCQQHQTNPCTPPAGIEMLQEVQMEPAWQVWSCILTGCAINLLNDLGERHTLRRLLTRTGQINKHAQLFSPLAGGDFLVHAKG